MHSHDEFWLQLHDLESNLNSDDLPVENKAEKLVGYLVQYPPVARQQIEEEFAYVMRVFTALSAAIAKSPPSKYGKPQA